jgi:hypothetical protein
MAYSLSSIYHSVDIVTPLRAQVARAPAVQRIAASDIGNHVLIVGNLGSTLGQLVTIQGEWFRPEAAPGGLPLKDIDWRLRVTDVDGKRLDQPVIFLGRRVSPLFVGKTQVVTPRAGDVWEMRGIEIGRYEGVPNAVLKEVFQDGMIPAIGFGFGFYTHFWYSSCRVVRRAQTLDPPNLPAPPAQKDARKERPEVMPKPPL